MAQTMPPPVSGSAIDPPPKETPKKVRQWGNKDNLVGTIVGVGYRAFYRFSHAKVPLLAAGTTYYLFFSIFALLAFAYGLAATIGSEQISSYVTEALGEAFPGLVGDGRLDPDQLRAAGQTASILGLVGLLYGGLGGVNAAYQSVHLVYGAPKDPRNIVVAKLRLLGWLLALAPLILLSFVASTVTSTFAGRVFEAIGLERGGTTILLQIGAGVLTLAVDFLIVYLILSHFGGVRPDRRSRVVGAIFGAIAIEVLKRAMTVILAFAIDKPQYGALTAPIGILLVLYLQSMALYVSAALAAGAADRNVPLSELEVEAA
ncbi:MAG: YihY/virulence factor BrkB family protein [Actinobacteria bacterium]|nr:YihY/virulence factor BrkB family protein [Actinomycetota bacterium]MCB9413621.1 YihY/virulence factor BrkB family protein [Actinomycetota bacterium]